MPGMDLLEESDAGRRSVIASDGEEDHVVGSGRRESAAAPQDQSRATGFAVAVLPSISHKLKTDVLVDQRKQMIVGKLIFKFER